ncbi:hypothetical protein ECC02_010711 [Trypanosoma cruzi]|uniref:Uncharacterized protein n=1 Tax=Trypanosoma cruzi TaxID=5693 RepID=A0A7J6XQ04_TRYCR|nr:hypothetical protein ECC02_010711 [Trypanosoma cruzi]
MIPSSYPEAGLGHSILVHPPPQPPLLNPFQWITTRSPPLETRRHLHHYSCASNRSLHPHCSNRPSRVQKPHRTTARRGHTPAAHGQSSSSPSLLSLACSLQHKLTTRQQRVKAKRRDKSHSHAPSHPAMRVTHQNNNLVDAVQQQSKKKEELSSPCTVPHTHTVTITVIHSTQALTGTPRSLQHAPLQHRPRNRRAFPAHAAVMHSRCAATYATSSLSPAAPCPPRPPQSLPCHRYAQHTQRHDVVPPLLPNHERSTQLVLAHVLHALQPPADPPHRHALHLVVLIVLGADPPILSIHVLVLQEAAEGSHVCVKDPKVRGVVVSHPRSVPRTSPHPPIAHTQGRCHGREREVRRKTHA